MQDTKNRQNSISLDNNPLKEDWEEMQTTILCTVESFYKKALAKGMAKECARVILPEGLTPSRLYMSGTIRSFIHFCNVRQGNGTQKEHIEVANMVAKIFEKELPTVWEALNEV